MRMSDTLRSIVVGVLRKRRRRRSPHPNPPTRCAVLDLPPEILEEIFLRCMPPGEWGSLSAYDAPWLLLKVCCSWREVALSTPSLWSRLPSLPHMLKGSDLELLKLYLENSAGTAISISFRLPQDLDGAHFLPLITPYLSQSRHLNIVYFNDPPEPEPVIAHTHFPLLKILELSCRFSENIANEVFQGQPTIMGLEGIRFPWAQLTQLTIEFYNTMEILTLLRSCSSLEIFHLRVCWYARPETPHMPPKQKAVHHHLRTILFEDDSRITDPFEGLLGCLITPALSTLEFTQFGVIHWIGHHTMESILSFIRNSSAELTSLTLNGILFSPQQLIDLSTLIPMVTELDLYGIGGDSFQLLTIKSNSPHDILFPRLERLVIRHHSAIYWDSDPGLSYCSDMFHSRLYLAPNTVIVENMSPLQHAELHLASLVNHDLLGFDGLDQLDRQGLQKLIRSLRSVYLGTGFGKEVCIGKGARRRSTLMRISSQYKTS
ncbi:hypothetical protein BD779DRAFT_498205 [Infundibulicybe gibba]|nr:hypothetical protein BD779DRAFT_498205 [Infundibulicybe gibba]